MARTRIGDRPQRLQHFLQRIGRVRIVDDDERTAVAAEPLHPSRHRGKRTEQPRGFGEWNAECRQAAEHAERVRNVEAPRLVDARFDASPARDERNLRAAGRDADFSRGDDTR
jgi:hypothetical protein